MTYWLRLFFLKKETLWVITVYFLLFTTLFLFNMVSYNLHAGFWKKIKTGFPDNFLLPENGIDTVFKFEKLKIDKTTLIPYYSQPAIIESDTERSGVILYGYYDLSKRLNYLKNIEIIEGLESNGLVIGKELAYFLNIKIGDNVKIFFPDFSDTFFVCGIFDTGFYDYDNYYVFGNQRYIAKKSGEYFISGIECYTTKGIKIDGYKLLSFWDKNQNLKRAKRAERLIFNILYVFFWVVFLLAIFNVLFYKLVQRERYIALLNVLGMNKLKILWILFIDNLLALIIGLITSFFMVYIFTLFVPVYHLPSEVYGINGIYFDLKHSFKIRDTVFGILSGLILLYILIRYSKHADMLYKIR